MYLDCRFGQRFCASRFELPVVASHVPSLDGDHRSPSSLGKSRENKKPAGCLANADDPPRLRERMRRNYRCWQLRRALYVSRLRRQLSDSRPRPHSLRNVRKATLILSVYLELDGLSLLTEAWNIFCRALGACEKNIGPPINLLCLRSWRVNFLYNKIFQSVYFIQNRHLDRLIDHVCHMTKGRSTKFNFLFTRLLFPSTLFLLVNHVYRFLIEILLRYCIRSSFKL